MNFFYRTLASFFMLRLYICALPWSYSTVDWRRWRHKTTA